MTKDLFGNVDRRANQQANKHRRFEPDRRPAIPEMPVGRPQFFVAGGRSYSRAELYDLVGFRQLCAERPADDLVVVVDTARPLPHEIYVVALPRNHPSRFDESGRRDPARAPFWGHGEVMYIKGKEISSD